MKKLYTFKNGQVFWHTLYICTKARYITGRIYYPRYVHCNEKYLHDVILIAKKQKRRC